VRLFIIILTFLTLTSCKNTLDKTFQRDSLDEDLNKIRENNISSHDFTLLSLYIAMIELKRESPEGKSYRELLTEARLYHDKELVWNKKQKELTDKKLTKSIDK